MFKTLAPQSTDDLWPFAEQPQGNIGGQSSLMPWLAAGIGACASAIVQLHHRRKAHRELAALDTRMLKDIGIERSEIGRIVRYGRSG
jgi:uncharacterized protein YjiS (DUF1127 family)